MSSFDPYDGMTDAQWYARMGITPLGGNTPGSVQVSSDPATILGNQGQTTPATQTNPNSLINTGGAYSVDPSAPLTTTVAPTVTPASTETPEAPVTDFNSWIAKYGAQLGYGKDDDTHTTDLNGNDVATTNTWNDKEAQRFKDTYQKYIDAGYKPSQFDGKGLLETLNNGKDVTALKDTSSVKDWDSWLKVYGDDAGYGKDYTTHTTDANGNDVENTNTWNSTQADAMKKAFDTYLAAGYEPSQITAQNLVNETNVQNDPSSLFDKVLGVVIPGVIAGGLGAVTGGALSGALGGGFVGNTIGGALGSTIANTETNLMNGNPGLKNTETALTSGAIAGGMNTGTTGLSNSLAPTIGTTAANIVAPTVTNAGANALTQLATNGDIKVAPVVEAGLGGGITAATVPLQNAIAPTVGNTLAGGITGAASGALANTLAQEITNGNLNTTNLGYSTLSGLNSGLATGATTDLTQTGGVSPTVANLLTQTPANVLTQLETTGKIDPATTMGNALQNIIKTTVNATTPAGSTTTADTTSGSNTTSPASSGAENTSGTGDTSTSSYSDPISSTIDTTMPNEPKSPIEGATYLGIVDGEPYWRVDANATDYAIVDQNGDITYEGSGHTTTVDELTKIKPITTKVKLFPTTPSGTTNTAGSTGTSDPTSSTASNIPLPTAPTPSNTGVRGPNYLTNNQTTLNVANPTTALSSFGKPSKYANSLAQIKMPTSIQNYLNYA